MRKIIVFCIVVFIQVFVITAQAENYQPFFEENVILLQENYDIPATICIPNSIGPFAAVVMLHDTGSNRNEVENAYVYAAHIFAENYNIATIRFDFPGNGESQADYLLYTFHSAVNDAKKAAEYLLTLDLIDGDRIGILGWGQGGTNALLSCAWEPEIFKSVVTWAASPEMSLDGSLSIVDYEEAKKNGYYVKKFDWRDSLEVSIDWCEDVMTIDVLNEFGTKFVGPVLAIHGKDDTIVDPEWSNKIVEASSNIDSRLYYIEGMDHTFNLFTGDLSGLNTAIDATGEFFTMMNE